MKTDQMESPLPDVDDKLTSVRSDPSPTSIDLTVETSDKAWKRGFWMLIATQFQGALNENGFKQLIVFLVLGMGLQQADRDRLVLVVGALFAIPYVLFSMSGGFLADRYSKRTVIIGIKLFEVAVMLLAIAGLARQNLNLEFAAVFLASTQSALFGPSKYGLLPEILPNARLSWGNGILELGTFLGVIVGAASAGIMADGFRGHQVWSGLVFLGLAILGLATSLGVTRVPAAAPAKKFVANPLADLWAQGRLIRADRVLWLAVLGNTYFWFLATLLTANIAFYGRMFCISAPREPGFFRSPSPSVSAWEASRQGIFPEARSSMG